MDPCPWPAGKIDQVLLFLVFREPRPRLIPAGRELDQGDLAVQVIPGHNQCTTVYYDTVVQSQNAVSAYSTSKQKLPFGFAEN